MPYFREAQVDDARSSALLADYFSSRASTFPASMGAYRVALPVPSDFVPPAGVFLLVEVDVDGETAGGVTTAVGCGGIRLLPAPADTPPPAGSPHPTVAPRAAGVLRAEIKHVWVDPSVRGRGLGRMLLAELETRAAALGATELVLDTNAAQQAAAHLYRDTGYVDIPPYNDNPNATHWFRKDLAATATT